MGIDHVMPFVVTALFFIMTPGIDTFFILNKSVSQGRRAGAYAAFGVNAGVLVHTALAALGLTVVIAKSAMVFMLIKYLGVGYLVYLGIAKWLSKEDILPTKNEPTLGAAKNDFWAGFVTNALNPKVALFFLAFFPQFIDADQMDNPIPFLVLGLIYAAIGLVWFILLTVFASVFRERLMKNPKTGNRINKLSGLAFVAMGVKVAVSR